MQVFTRVVDTNSFTRAAESLSMPRASISTIIRNLEAFLGTRLIQRTTRRLSLTPDGAAYYERCQRILAEIAEAEASFQQANREPHGRLRIDIPPSIGRLVVIPRLREFRSRYPEIELRIGLSDRRVDLIEEGIDCALRVGALEDSSMVARRIGLLGGVTVASPEYIKKAGLPITLKDLERHTAVNYFSGRDAGVIDWSFLANGKEVEVRMKGSISVNDADAYLTCGLEGFGLIQCPRFMVLPYLRTGQLVEVMPEMKPAPLPVSAVYSHSRHLSPKVRVFVDWMAALWASCPLLDGSSSDEEGCVVSRREASIPASVMERHRPVMADLLA
ncbi:LysR family transcriptional regulator for bpeEF and oprC [Paraburkholderia sp. GAS199]